MASSLPPPPTSPPPPRAYQPNSRPRPPPSPPRPPAASPARCAAASALTPRVHLDPRESVSLASRPIHGPPAAVAQAHTQQPKTRAYARPHLDVPDLPRVAGLDRDLPHPVHPLPRVPARALTPSLAGSGAFRVPDAGYIGGMRSWPTLQLDWRAATVSGRQGALAPRGCRAGLPALVQPLRRCPPLGLVV